jgi:hypothetical protein
MAREEITVFIAHREGACAECGRPLEGGEWITLKPTEGEVSEAFCLECSDLDHLVFLARGDAALTRRAGRHSTLRAVVVQWSRRRKRYERQGTLVEEQALQRAEEECLADVDQRSRRAERRRVRDAASDREYLIDFTHEILKRYPKAPPQRAAEIAQHACQKYSGRVGRSAAAKDLDPRTIELAVRAHLRHTATPYDDLLMSGVPRQEARARIREQLDRAEEAWQG